MARRASAVNQEVAPDPVQTLRYELAAVIKRIDALEANRPGRKAKPLIALRQDGVCAVSPDIDSSECPDSSIFRYQQGCHGAACKAKQHAAYERRKTAKAEVVTPVPKPKRTPTKAAPKPKTTKTVAKKVPPAKRVAALVAG